MAIYTAEILWARSDQMFTDNRYSRQHTLRFDSGIEIAGSSSPHVVPLPYSVVDAVDPEEAFTAALSSCHLLTFLAIASMGGYVVDTYEDAPVGFLEKGDSGKPWLSRVVLHPKVTFSGEKQPSAEDLEKLHHKAHVECFLANSVKTEVTWE
jgi:organic hydroperoxide reductase OsmC/OhrA